MNLGYVQRFSHVRRTVQTFLSQDTAKVLNGLGTSSCHSDFYAFEVEEGKRQGV